ncbi:hypothetical protein [Synechocystis sp. PCC 7509]|uniref:hypothetical protein n=1 Tax=Synechocystis sp. PCC 7509 TaxID=927677 RepID=UPI0002AC30ED|nr:hypothetical protein [Synechocystis sp. PCC 7509]
MAIIALKAWYLNKYEPLQELEKRPHDLRLSKNSLLKSALRADFLEDSAEIKQSGWFQRYLDGEVVEFYIEGSGGYTIANIDLSSHEIYFIKQTTIAQIEPTIFLCNQNEYPQSSQILRASLVKVLENLNKRSRFPITLVESSRSGNSPLRLSSTATRKIRKSLLFIADGTPLAQIDGTTQLILSPSVCVEIGYAVTSKRSEQILIAQMSRQLLGQYPFELPSYQSLPFEDSAELDKVLPQVIETQLQRFNLFS